MRRWWIKTILCGVMLATVQPAFAATRYEEPNLINMVDFLFANGAIDPTDPEELVDYVLIKDCNLYKNYYQDDFAWNKIRTRIIGESKALRDDVTTHFVVPTNFMITRYNFTTKAFDIEPDSQLSNVNVMALTKENIQVCAGINQLWTLKRLPYNYFLKLDTPLSLYRLPMADDMARQILGDMMVIKNEATAKRQIYALVYMAADSVLDISVTRGILLGRVDKIEFFLDQKRTQKIRTLVYSDL